jgi:hypothetical protein
MARRRSSARDVAEIAMTAPLIVGQRLARLADPSPRRRKANETEAVRMFTEKAFAFADAWSGIGFAAFRTQLEIFGALAKGGSVAGAISKGSAAMSSAATQPVRRRVAANARRLKKRR